MNIQLGAGVLFLGFLALSWFSGTLLGLVGRDLWLLRGALAAIGITGYAVFMVLYQKGGEKIQGKGSGTQSGGAPGAPSGPAPGGAEEVDFLVRDAEARLTASRLAQDAKLSNLPVIFLIGETGSTKTSTMLNSGLEPELLAGHIYQDNQVASTRAANIWFVRQNIFVEVGGKLLSDAGRWARLLRRLVPGRLKSVVGTSGQAPRAALVCFDGESFVRPGAAEAITNAARGLQGRLGEISQAFGISFPVYVLFTRTDRVPFFADFVRNLTAEEVTQVFGVTLPIRSSQSTGVYAEEETERLSAAFNRLVGSLCDKRIELLPRENDAEKLPGAYEFPREFRKLRAPVVQFLVDLCRPSQLRASPFLRGFYFSGVRPVIVNEMAAPGSPFRGPERSAYDPGGGATRIFKAPGSPEQAASAQFTAPTAGMRKVPQWLFLTHLFNDVMLADRTALGASGASVKTSTLRKGLLIAASVISLLLLLAFTISFFGNQALEDQVLTAARAVPVFDARQGNLPSQDSLEKLESLRQSLFQLTEWEQAGPPLRLRWFLYTGGSLYPHTRQAYYNRFRQLLLGPTQGSIVAGLKALPVTSGPTDDYQYSYDSLKAYLITTPEWKRSTREFLSPVLMNRWQARREIDPQRTRLAKLQFDFYGDDLKNGNPYDSGADEQAVDRARRYLASFAGYERIYRFMLAEANKQNPPVNFNQKFPGSAEVVVNNKDVPGAFTKTGWTFMQSALKRADQYFGGERWVLGDYNPAGVDRSKLEQELRNRYNSEFIATWRQYLRNSSVVKYSDLKDAAAKLNKTSSNQSPLLALFWLCSHHTNVDDQKVKEAFDPVHKTVPPTETLQLVAPPNTNYVNTLVTLQTSIDQAANQNPPEPATAQQTMNNATSARIATKQLANVFRIDQEGNVHALTQKLLEDPITNVEALLRGLGPAEVNGKAKGFCAQFNLLGNKYPFNPNTREEATLQDTDAIFRPGQGALWAFYEATLKSSLQRQGSTFVANPEAQVKLTDAFVGFFNRAAALSDALYREGAGQPKLTYALTPLKSEGVQGLAITIDGQVLQAAGAGGSAKTFVWPSPGGRGEARLAVSLGGPQLGAFSYDGLWAAFRLFGDAERLVPTGGGFNVEWIVRAGGKPLTLPGGAPLTVRFLLDLKGSPAFFQKGYFAQLRCVSQAAR